MNSIHDLGGMHGMGKIPLEENEPFFHEDWERRTLGTHLMILMTGLAVGDEGRYSMERIEALHWLASPYYEHWLDGTETILIEKGIATREELETGQVTAALPDWARTLSPVEPDAVEGLVRTNHPVTGDAETAPRYKAGDNLRAININPKGHTRLPRYTRGKPCTVIVYRGACLFADARASGNYGAVDHTYTVRFEGRDLWGPDGGVKDAVYIDLYERYLEKL